MTKATHNGTCQACGRTQAVTARGNIAKHGYTTAWGFFSGTCSGSDHQPLETGTAHNVETVDALLNWANQQTLVANGTTPVTKVPVEKRITRLDGRRATVTDWMTRDEFAALDQRNIYNTFDDRVVGVRRDAGQQADNARRTAADLETLRGTVHGQPLQARAVEAELVREYFKFDREGRTASMARMEELKAQGIKATRRRPNYGSQIVITFRK